MSTNEADLSDLSHKEQIEALNLAHEELARILVVNAIKAETMLRALTSLAQRTGVAPKNLAKILGVINKQVVADMKAGKFNPLKFDKAPPFEERLGLTIPPHNGG